MSYEKVTQQVGNNLIIGTKQTLKAMKDGEVSEVLVANDVDERLTRKVTDLAKQHNIPCVRVNSKKKLGVACGIDVGAATVAIKKS